MVVDELNPRDSLSLFNHCQGYHFSDVRCFGGVWLDVALDFFHPSPVRILKPDVGQGYLEFNFLALPLSLAGHTEGFP